jgi:hypothetical protein
MLYSLGAQLQDTREDTTLARGVMSWQQMLCRVRGTTTHASQEHDLFLASELRPFSMLISCLRCP